MALSNNRKMKFENLEDRRLMAADIDLDANGIIQIEGTDENDTIEISYTYDNAEIDEVLVVIRDADGDVIEDKDYDVEDVNWINVYAKDGDDYVVNNTDINMTADGGAGRLRLKSRSQQDFLQVGLVPACGEAFVFDADLRGRLLLQ
jgi:hypothetical protein